MADGPRATPEPLTSPPGRELGRAAVGVSIAFLDGPRGLRRRRASKTSHQSQHSRTVLFPTRPLSSLTNPRLGASPRPTPYVARQPPSGSLSLGHADAPSPERAADGATFVATDGGKLASAVALAHASDVTRGGSKVVIAARLRDMQARRAALGPFLRRLSSRRCHDHSG